MGLLDLRTDLKSLKYGHDQPGNGSSNQPYIKVDINDVDSGFNRLRFTRFDDGLIRGGAVGAINASATDTLRIGKFLVDFPKGPLFIVKQVGLQLSNPRLESKNQPTDKPTTGGGFFNNIGNFISNTANRIENAVGPTRLYNLGINTLAQIPVNAIGGHIVRHGFLPIADPSKYYENVVTENAGLLDNSVGHALEHNRLLLLRNKFDTNPSEIIIDQYTGGPGSVYGIGNTLIRRATTLEGAHRSYGWSSDKAGRPLINNERQTFTYYNSGLSRPGAIYSGLGKSNNFSDNNIRRSIGGFAYKNSKADKFGAFSDINPKFLDPPTIAEGIDVSVYNENYVSSSTGRAHISSSKINETSDYAISEKTGSIFANLGFKLNNLWPNSVIPDISFRYDANAVKDIAQSSTKAALQQTIDPKSLNPKTKSSDNTPSKGATIFDPQQSLSNTANNILSPYTAYITNPSLATYTDLKNKITPTFTISQLTPDPQPFKTIDIPLARAAVDYKYNLGYNFYSEFNRTNDLDVDDDTLAIKFTPINPFTGDDYGTIKFLAYITDFSNDFKSGWGDVKYVGRAEKFYIFNEFERTVSLGFNIPCYNAIELNDKHNDLNNLASILAGNYKNHLLGGIITRLKVGNYIDNQPGIITSLNFSIVEGSSWDLDDELAFYIKVSINFTVIHNFLPRYRQPFITVPTHPVTVDNDPDVDPPPPPPPVDVSAASLFAFEPNSNPGWVNPSPGKPITNPDAASGTAAGTTGQTPAKPKATSKPKAKSKAKTQSSYTNTGQGPTVANAAKLNATTTTTNTNPLYKQASLTGINLGVGTNGNFSITDINTRAGIDNTYVKHYYGSGPASTSDILRSQPVKPNGTLKQGK